VASTVFVNSVTLTAAAWFQDVDNIAYQYLSAVAGTNAITATGPSGLGAYAAGLKFRFIPAVTNTGATTINITGSAALGVRNIFFNNVALIGGELVAGIPVEIVDDGTRFQISGTPPSRSSIIKRKTADQSITTSTTLTDDTHLTFAIAANEEWTFSIEASCGDSLSVTGLKAAITVPAGATLRVNGSATAGTGASPIVQGSTTTSGTIFINNSTLGAGTGYLKAMVWVLNGATPGNITLQWAQGTSSGTALTFHRGSFMQAIKVA
jgi:hypothetical protein